MWSITCKKYRVGSLIKNELTGITRTVISIEEDGSIIVKYDENEAYGYRSGKTERLSHLTYEWLIQY